MKKRDIATLSALTFFMGVVFGFLISPVKQGMGNNSGNNITKNYYGEKDRNEDEAQ